MKDEGCWVPAGVVTCLVAFACYWFVHERSKLDTYEKRVVTEVIDGVGYHGGGYLVRDDRGEWHRLDYTSGVRRVGDRFNVVHHESLTGNRWTTAIP